MTTDSLKLDDDPLESQEFFDLMQAYRHTSLASQTTVCRRFEEVKDYVRNQVVKPIADELKVAKEFIAEHVGVEPETEREPSEVN